MATMVVFSSEWHGTVLEPTEQAMDVAVPVRGNIDSRLLATVLLRNLAREGRLARLRIALKDQPGALHKVVSLFERHNVNIIEVYHQRVFTKLPAKGLITDIECEARNKSQVDALIADMRGAGYDVHPVELA